MFFSVRALQVWAPRKKSVRKSTFFHGGGVQIQKPKPRIGPKLSKLASGPAKARLRQARARNWTGSKEETGQHVLGQTCLGQSSFWPKFVLVKVRSGQVWFWPEILFGQFGFGQLWFGQSCPWLAGIVSAILRGNFCLMNSRAPIGVRKAVLVRASAKRLHRKRTRTGWHTKFASSRNVDNCSPGRRDAATSSNAPCNPNENKSGIRMSPCSPPFQVSFFL